VKGSLSGVFLYFARPDLLDRFLIPFVVQNVRTRNLVGSMNLDSFRTKRE